MKEDNINVKHSDIREMTTAIRDLVRHLELRFKGYIWDADGNEFR